MLSTRNKKIKNFVSETWQWVNEIIRMFVAVITARLIRIGYSVKLDQTNSLYFCGGTYQLPAEVVSSNTGI